MNTFTWVFTLRHIVLHGKGYKSEGEEVAVVWGVHCFKGKSRKVKHWKVKSWEGEIMGR